MKKTVLRTVLMSAWMANAACAADGWDLTAGVGVFGDSAYVGSDERYLVPLPTFTATYATERYSYAISLMDGLSASYQNPDSGLIGSIGLNVGEDRKRDAYSIAGFDTKYSDRTRKLLADAPNLSTPITANTMLGYVTPVGMVGVNVGYYPTDVESAQLGVEDETNHGLLYSILYLVDVPIGDRLSIAGMLSLDFMNQSYADAWYSVGQETDALAAFDADAGLRDVLVAVQIDYSLSERFGMSLIGTNTILMEDARKSPYSVEPIHRTMSLELFYRF